MNSYQRLAAVAAVLLLIMGFFLLSTNPRPSNLHYTSLSFLCVGAAIFIVALMSWLSSRYEKLPLLIIGLVGAGFLMLVGVIMALISYMY